MATFFNSRFPSICKYRTYDHGMAQLILHSSRRQRDPDPALSVRQIPRMGTPGLGYHSFWDSTFPQSRALDLQGADVCHYHVQYRYLHYQLLRHDLGAENAHVLQRDIRHFWIPVHVDALCPDDGYGPGGISAAF